MMISILLVTHIAVLGYWLGSELVINSTFRYISWASSLDYRERNRLMDHVMNVDQHVRYALVLQLGLGFALAALYGFVPGHTASAWTALALMAAWLIFVEVVHRKRSAPIGDTLAAIDRRSRYLLLLALIVYGGMGLASMNTLPAWLSLKLLGFAGVISCGVGIRFALIHWFRVWLDIRDNGSSASNEQALRSAYTRATAVLIGLWVFIAGIVYLSVWKPALGA